MYLLIAVLIIGVVTIKKSLDNIEKSTVKLEKYANEIYKKAKLFESIAKQTLQADLQ